MAEIKYTYSVSDDFLNGKVDVDTLTESINASDTITIALSFINKVGDDCDIWFKDLLSLDQKIVLDNMVFSHTGEPTKFINSVAIVNEWRDKSGKLRVHQTSRKLGLRTNWTSVGDSRTDCRNVGGGTNLFFKHTVGENEPTVKYMDFNTIENETYIHEGYITWKDCLGDMLTLDIVPSTVNFYTVSGTNYKIYDGVVVPAYPLNTGSIELSSDITTHSGGLIYCPNDDLGNNPTAYWDADWNSYYSRYENIRPNYYGTGRYNMFSEEKTLITIINKMHLIADGFIALNCSDTEEFGNGMRLRITFDTNNDVEDHNWMCACVICMHRDKSVSF